MLRNLQSDRKLEMHRDLIRQIGAKVYAARDITNDVGSDVVVSPRVSRFMPSSKSKCNMNFSGLASQTIRIISVE